MTPDEQLDLLKDLLARVRSSAEGPASPKAHTADSRPTQPVTPGANQPALIAESVTATDTAGSKLTAFSETETGTHAPLALVAATFPDTVLPAARAALTSTATGRDGELESPAADPVSFVADAAEGGTARALVTSQTLRRPERTSADGVAPDLEQRSVRPGELPSPPAGSSSELHATRATLVGLEDLAPADEGGAPASQRQIRAEDRPVDRGHEDLAEPPPESGEVESQRYGKDSDEIGDLASSAATTVVDIVQRLPAPVEIPVAAFTGTLLNRRLATFGEVLDSALDL